MDWLKIILAIAPRAKPEIARGLAESMPEIVSKWGVETTLDQAHFLAQTAYEADGYRTTVEYASGDAYDTRTDLGFTAARDGDGRKFKGFGLIQSTGPKNQKAAAAALGILAEWRKNPRILATFPYAALSAAFYWKAHGLSAIANRDDVETVTRRINGGLNGFADRKTYLARAKKALGIMGEVGRAHVEGAEPLPRERVRLLQRAIMAAYPLGEPDGRVGRQTIKAISAFQADRGLAVTGAFDPATIEAIEAGPVGQPQTAPRATAKPVGSRILGGATRLKVTAATLCAPAAAKLLDDPLTALEGASGQWSRIKALVEPFGGVVGLVGQHWPLALIGVAAIVFVLASGIAMARIEDHETGKTP